MDQMDMPVMLTLDGPDARTVLMELDSGGRVELSPAQARALAADLEAMADEAES